MTPAPAPGLQREPPRATLGRYRLLCELGSGGMARVYLGLATGLAGFTKLVVLKVMREELAENSETLNMFLGEARLAARLSHPNIVQTLEVGEDGGCYFIGMEYLDGLPLNTLMAKTILAPLPLQARLGIACQMLDGLSYLHELADLDGSPLGLVHRDISPGNVFVTFDGTVKVLDFGVAKAAGLSEVSVVGSFKGKLGYAAPEQMTGQSDARSDVFTAGLLLWEMLSARRLNLNRTTTEIIRGRITGADTDLMQQRGRGIPPELLEICFKAAASDPADRYQSASALREALRGYMLAHSLQSSPEQLRGLLAERFDELRRATRQRIDRRLKEIREEDASLATGVAGQWSSQVPPALVNASQSGSLNVTQLLRTRRRALILTAGVSVLVGAALAGAMVLRNRPFGAVAAVGQAQEVVSSPLTATDTGPAIEMRSAADVSEETDADSRKVPASVTPNQHNVAALEVLELPIDKGSRPGDNRRAPRRVGSRVPSAKRKDPLESRKPGAQDVDSRPASASPEVPSLSGPNPGDTSDFVHDRKSTKSARPIDTASPYSN